MNDLLGDNRMMAIVPFDEPSPIAFANVYHPGDLWVKRIGCDACDDFGVRHCCGKCVFLMDNRDCAWHNEARQTRKPYSCVVEPDIRAARSFCKLEYDCVAGPDKGKTRRACDPDNVLR